jgi:NADH-ubiquinone oxidoreductase chain 5
VEKIDYYFSIVTSFQCLLFLITVLIISLFVFLWSSFYIQVEFKIGLFYLSLLFFVVSMCFLVFSNRLFVVFLGWEGLGVSSFLLIIFYQNWVRRKGGLLTLLTNRLGDGVLIISFCLFFSVSSFRVIAFSRGLLIILLFFLRITKRAQ